MKIIIFLLFMLSLNCIVDYDIYYVPYESIQGQWVTSSKIYIHNDNTISTHYRYMSFTGDEFRMYEEVFYTCDGRRFHCPPGQWMKYAGTKVYMGTSQELGFGNADIANYKMLNIYFQRVHENMTPVIDNQIVGTIVLLEQKGDTLIIGYSNSYRGMDAIDTLVRFDLTEKLNNWYIY